MNELEKYKYVQIDGLKKKQIDLVIFNSKFAIEKPIEDIDKLNGRFVFFIISNWLCRQEDFPFNTTKLYGRITDVRPKSFQINFSMWFPKSQLKKIFVKTTKQQYRLINFME